jgi:hypothetical protein
MVTLTHKTKNIKVKAETKGNKIITKKGFVVLVGSEYFGSRRVNSDIIERDFFIPKNYTLG